MDIKNFVLSYYTNATENFYIDRIEEPVEALKLHTHNYFQLYYILQGSVNHHLGKETATLCCGDVFIIPPDVRHYISKNEHNTVFYAMSFMPDFFKGTEQCCNLLADFLRYLVNVPAESVHPRLLLTPKDSILAETLLDRIMTEFTEKGVGSEELVRESAALLITLFARNYFSGTDDCISLVFEENKKYVLQCINYISTNFTEEITLEDIAHHSAMSKTCFCRLFSSITGMGFKTFLNTKRIEKAKELILNDYKITTVDRLCGYEDFSTFYRNFKKITGLSPRQYKKTYIS